LRSISRTMPNCHDDAENQMIAAARSLMAVYDDMAEMIRLGAYRPGADSNVDQAIHYHPMLEEFLTQAKTDSTSLPDCFGHLSRLLQLTPEITAQQSQLQVGDQAGGLPQK
jgi:flagellum-specific ATP synthase